MLNSSSIRESAKQLRDEWFVLKRRHPRIIRNATRAAGALVLVLLVFGLWSGVSLVRNLPTRAEVEKIGDMNQATAVFDREDQLAFTIFKEQRIDVPIGRISPQLISAILAIEDQRFYEHHGFDLVRIVSAALVNLRQGRAAQGGSTITQQLARQSFLTADKKYTRKIQELVLASRIERMYSKQRILELYLNKVYFGDGYYGVEAASRGYFGKHASDLTLSEAALLAGLVQSPSRYSPTVNLTRAKARRNVVLQAMLDTHAIDRAAWTSARDASVSLKDGFHGDNPFGQYFQEQVRLELVQRFGWERVYQGGLRVFSTIDTAMQRAAEAAVASQLTKLDERLAKRKSNKPEAVPAKPEAAPAKPEEPLQAALIALDPVTGDVRAMVGGRSFDDSHFNRAVQAKRQPGSAFKPLVYAAALEAGYTPATMIEHLNDPIDTLQGAWTPEEGHSNADAMSLRTALRTSSNRAAVRLLEDVGIPKAVTYAKNMGVGDVPSVPSLALGSGEVTLQSLTAAYAAFANHGNVPHPTLVRRVEDRDGHVLYTAPRESSRAISDQTAFLMSTMMADVVNAGTAAGVRAMGFTLPAAGKTGTTNDFHDAWFVGFTPSLVAGVWVGFDQPRTILPNGFAADLAVPLWTTFMKDATKGAKPVWLKAPSGIVTARVCRMSGKLAVDGCDSVEVVDEEGHKSIQSLSYNEYFVAGTEPKDQCDLHKPRGIIGAIASIFHDPQPTPRIVDTGLPQPMVTPPPPPAAAAEAPTIAEAPQPKEKEKRGFWSRVFGFGKKDDPKKSDKKK
ncbi:MAG TPA: PBP1A family penicillin-binding protein [Vicinamibacterales bacterium]|jgi:penicillin-binding protein 1A|nr:PBP1A family penicillin-binding protein [Vicinamibacterales bacterium]